MKSITILLSLVLTTSLIGCAAKVQPTTSKNIISKAVLELKNGVPIYFESNSSAVKAEDQHYLAEAAQVLLKNSTYVLEVEGHTDYTGKVATNDRISLERANAVRDILVSQYNVNLAQIRTSGVGSLKPIATNTTAEGRAQNRRVSLQLKIQ